MHVATVFTQHVALIAHAEEFMGVLAAHVHCSMLLLHHLRSQVADTAMHLGLVDKMQQPSCCCNCQLIAYVHAPTLVGDNR